MHERPSAPLIATLWPQRGHEAVRIAVLVAAGIALLTLSAKLKVPFYPVPMTMQTLAVLALGVAYGFPLGALTVAAYLAAGAAGLPVFADTPAKGLGLAYMLGPTGGYLAGFLLAAALAGAAAARGWARGFVRVLYVMLVGHAVILLAGWVWLAHHIGPARAWQFGVAPFHAATALKSLLGAGLLSVAWRLRGG
ncbi:MAG: biotin transporter BioY [Variibacter sp.]|nr:biotin transporter BioY [Variibacter sp.]